VYLAFGATPGGPIASWISSAPNVFDVSPANDSSSDLTTAAGGTMFAMRSNNATEIRGADLTLVSTPAEAELETIPNRVAVPGVAMHPSGADLRALSRRPSARRASRKRDSRPNRHSRHS